MFERVNKINVSMFERLINAPQIHQVPSNALSIQRRMRRNICDLTRDFYVDIVEIEDHEQCATKKIGEKLAYAPKQQPRSRLRGTNTNAMKQLNKCEGSGREIPGILPHVFFWTHEGIQTKAEVGLSRINKGEAAMAIQLTNFLVNSCGVPKQCIAVLTPYKGQLMLMRKLMMNMGLLDKFDQTNSVRMSTVDRFQGDEADIVIISLVIDAKSQTPFVKLQNRMVVLLSRARIGMYILGNIGYFQQQKTENSSVGHWIETINKLQQPSEPDTNPKAIPRDDVEMLHFPGPRIGPELPICCPIHRENMKTVNNPTQLKLDFCTIKCTVKLTCSHPCNMDCHFPHMDSHNNQCAERIKPPCSLHNTDLMCSDVYKNIGVGKSYQKSQMSIDEALKYYRCPAEVDVQLPCQHIVKMTCAEDTDIANDKESYPECKELAHSPFVYPGCLHELTVLCVT
jgi:hypothetical protein